MWDSRPGYWIVLRFCGNDLLFGTETHSRYHVLIMIFFLLIVVESTSISKLAKLSLLNESSVSITVSQVKGIGYIMPLNVLLTTFNLNLQSFILLKPRFFKKVSSCQVLMSTWSTTALSRQATCPLY